MVTLYDSVGQLIHVGDMVAHIIYGNFGVGSIEKGIVVGIGKYKGHCEVMKWGENKCLSIISCHLVVMRNRIKLSDYMRFGYEKHYNI